MNIFTVSFFGHRIIPEFREAEDRVEALVHALLLEKEYVEFLVGRDGDFDQIVSSTVKRQQRLVRDDNSSLIWILPYPTAELRNNMENFEAYYDEIEICGSAASSHPKGAFQIRNRQMVSEAISLYSMWIIQAVELIRPCAMRRKKKRIYLILLKKDTEIKNERHHHFGDGAHFQQQ